MGTKPSDAVKDAFDLIKGCKKKGLKCTAVDAADIFKIHVTTIYRHKPYIEWRKSQKGK